MSILEAGFIFWGLLLVLAGIIVGYLLWMIRTERGSGGDRERGARKDSGADAR